MRKFLFNFSIILLASCKPDSNDTESENIFPVIEGYMKSGSNPEIKIYRQLSTSGDNMQTGIEGLNVSLVINSTEYQMSDIGNGIYTIEDYVLQENDNLKLNFNYSTYEVSAETFIPSLPLEFELSSSTYEVADFSNFDPTSGSLPEIPDPLEVTWQNNDQSYYIVVVENIEDDPEPTVDFGDNEPPSQIFRIEPTQGAGLDLNSMQFEYLGTHLIRLYHVLSNYAALYDSNSNSSQNLQTPETGIENGVGIFTGISGVERTLEISFQ